MRLRRAQKGPIFRACGAKIAIPSILTPPLPESRLYDDLKFVFIALVPVPVFFPTNRVLNKQVNIIEGRLNLSKLPQFYTHCAYFSLAYMWKYTVVLYATEFTVRPKGPQLLRALLSSDVFNLDAGTLLASVKARINFPDCYPAICDRVCQLGLFAS